MKVTLDLDLLLSDGSIDAATYDRLRVLSARATSALAFNILAGFGIVAVGGAALAMLPTPATAIALGAAACAVGTAVFALRYTQWSVLAGFCVVTGVLLSGGGIIKLSEGSVGSLLAVAALLGIAAIAARSALLSVLATLVISACLGARTGYLHAAYFLGIEWPALTIVTFVSLGALLCAISPRAPADRRRVVIAAAATSAFLVNLGFWVGSLSGDRLANRTGLGDPLASVLAAIAVDWVFALTWAIALAAAGAWAWRRDRRWLLNLVAVFGAIDLYTQWFERLGASPASVLIAGLMALAIALALRAYNARPARA